MPKVDDEVLRQRFLKAKEAWDERQKANRARQRREKALADARRETLIGEDDPCNHVQDNPSHECDRLMSQLERLSLTDDKDRALFDLSVPRPRSVRCLRRSQKTLSRPSQIQANA